MRRVILMSLIVTAAIAMASGTAVGGTTRTAGVLCSDAVSQESKPAWPTVILGRVSLSKRIRSTGRIDGDRFPLFGKSGLFVLAGKAPVTLSIPPEWRARVGIEWSNRVGHGPVAVLRVQPCGGHEWLGYPGGFSVAAKGCVPLDVRVGSRHKRVWIAVGGGAGCPTT